MIDNAFITLLSSENYLDAVLCLYDSYKKYNNTYPFVVAVTSPLCRRVIVEPLQKAGIVVEIVPEYQYTDNVKNIWKGGTVLNTASKYSLFGLKQYEKLVYLDADMYIMDNIECLMKYPDGSMIYNPDYEATGGDRYGFTGAYVFKPENHEEIFYRILNENCDMVDGELIGKLWFFVMDSPSHQIPVSYCMGYDWWRRYPSSELHIAHFSGPRKPWLERFYEKNIVTTQYYESLEKVQQYKVSYTWRSVIL